MTDATAADDIEVKLGEYCWNWQTGDFHSSTLGKGKIVAWIDRAGEVYDQDELDGYIEPVLATVELLEGEHAGSFVNIDVTEEDSGDDKPTLH